MKDERNFLVQNVFPILRNLLCIYDQDLRQVPLPCPLLLPEGQFQFRRKILLPPSLPPSLPPTMNFLRRSAAGKGKETASFLLVGAAHARAVILSGELRSVPRGCSSIAARQVTQPHFVSPVRFAHSSVCSHVPLLAQDRMSRGMQLMFGEGE